MSARVLSLASIRRIYEHGKGKAWEPPDIEHPTVKVLIDGGWVKRCQMRCGFEAFDTGVKWTDAARIALNGEQPVPQENPNGSQ